MIQLTVILAYMALLVGLGLISNRLFRGTASDYLLASRSIGPFLLLMSLFGTTMTAFALVGSTGRAYTVGVGVYGLLASASGIVHSLCFFIVGVPLWSLGRRFGYTTQIQFFRDRLENDTIGLLLFPILVLLVICYLLLGVVAGGAVVNGVTAGTFASQGWFSESEHGVPAWFASGVICAVVLTYIFFGGMRGAAWANAFQTTVFMVLGLVTFVVIANAIGKGTSLLENMQRATQAVDQTQLARQGRIPQPVYFSFLLIPLSVAMFPHVFQHWLTARSAQTFKLPIIVHPIFIMIVWVPCVLLGVWASAPGSGVPAGTPENGVLATLVKTHAGPVLGGLLTAGILAAIMSSLDSQFLCVGTMFTHDVLLRQQTSTDDRRTVMMARCFVVIVVAITYALSLSIPRAVFDLGLWSFSGFTGLFPLVIAALYWRRLTAAGANAGVLAMIVTWLLLFWRSDFGANKIYGFPEPAMGLPIPTMLPVVTITLVSAIVTVAVSLMTRPPTEKTLARFFAARQ